MSNEDPYKNLHHRTKDLNDEAMALLLRNKALSQDFRVLLATQYIKTKYFYGRQDFEPDEVHQLIHLVDNFLSRIKTDESGLS